MRGMTRAITGGALMKFLMLVAGLVVLMASALADIVGFGDRIAFGRLQAAGVIGGLAVFAIWLIMQLRRERPGPLPAADATVEQHSAT